MPATYGGLRWGTSDWHYMSLTSAPTNTFLALSGNATFTGTPIGGADFYLDSVDIWSRRGLDANGDFYFVLYHDGATVYNGLVENDGAKDRELISLGFALGMKGITTAKGGKLKDQFSYTRLRNS